MLEYQVNKKTAYAQNGHVEEDKTEIVTALTNVINAQYIPGNGVDARLTCELFNLLSCL